MKTQPGRFRNNDLGAPDRAFSLAAYRDLANGYDLRCRRVEPLRRLAIALLALRPGDTVYDVASGTGLSHPLLTEQVGAAGWVVAIEQSPQMAGLARLRGLANVEHVVAPAEAAPLARRADALLFHYTHDVLRSPEALAHLFAHTAPGARVAVAGFTLPDGWAAVLNPWHRWRNWGYLSTFEGAQRPWSLLEKYVPDFTVVATAFARSGYVGVGRFAGGRTR